MDTDIEIEEETHSYIFVANCAGLHSVIPVDPGQYHALDLYCRYNMHRLEMWGILELTESVYNGLKELIKDPVCSMEILKSIKDRKFSLPSSQMNYFLSILARIPDPSIDVQMQKNNDQQKEWIKSVTQQVEEPEEELCQQP